MNEIKVLALCGSRFALPTLQELAFFNQLAAVAIPRHCTDMVEEVQALLKGSSIPILAVDKASFKEQLTRVIQQYNVTLGLVLSFSYKIPESVYTLPHKGFFNVHPGPLPQYRGADPVFQQLKNKEKQAGVTIHKLDKGLDTGPIVMKEMIFVEPGDTHGLLTTKLSHTAAGLIRTLLKLAALDLAIPSKPQDESIAGYFTRQEANDITINWQQMDAAAIVALVNACNPWNKGAVTKLNGKIIRLVEAEKINEMAGEQIAGTIIAFEDNSLLIVALGGEVVRIRIVYMEEGFLSAGRLQQFGVSTGTRFDSI